MVDNNSTMTAPPQYPIGLARYCELHSDCDAQPYDALHRFMDPAERRKRKAEREASTER